MKHIAFLLLFISLFLPVRTQSPTPLAWLDDKPQKHEVRAVWLTTIGGIDWPHTYNTNRQKEELQQTLDRLKAVGINTILLQTRVRATTIYLSAQEPWDGCLSGTPGRAPGYDALRFCIDECHRRGLELHAWVVTIPVGKWNALGCRQLRKRFPKLIKRIGEEGYMDPENVQTADYLAGICREITREYDVDGIHLDYIRYPETWRIRVSRQQGRQHITRIVRAIHDAVKAEKPWVKLSCAPIGKYDDLLRYRSGGWNAHPTVCQDAQQWLQTGLMDMLFPMMYFRDNNFFPFAIDWQEHSYGRIVVPGLGIYFLDPKEGRWLLSDVTRQLYVLRSLGMGHCYFRSLFLTHNTQGLYDFCQRFNATPALIPPMTWTGVQAPTPPSSLSLNGTLLNWSEAKDHSDSPYLLYNIYASQHFPVDTSDPSLLVCTRLKANQLQVPATSGINYAVTACNRYGMESEAAQLCRTGGDDDRYFRTNDILYCDGNTLRLPQKPVILDADYVIVETLMGQQLATHRYSKKPIDVSRLPNGIYALRSLGRKGRNHRIGYFSIYRR